MNSTGSLLYVHAGGVAGGGPGAIDALESEYDVVVAEGGLDAVKRISERPGAIDCVVTETTLTDLSLDAFLRRVAREAPTASVVAVGRPPEEPTAAASLAEVDAYVPEERTDALVDHVGRVRDDARVDEAVDRHRRLAGVVATIAADVADAGDRAEVEASVHDRLVGDGWYRHVWIGRRDDGGQLSLTVPVAGNVDEEDLQALVGGGDPAFVSRALETGRVVSTEGSVPTRGGTAASVTATLHDGGSTATLQSAAVPFVHDGRVWGLGVLSTERDGGFDGSERALLADLGAVVGHALWAIESDATADDRRTAAEEMENLVHELRNPLGIAQSHLVIAREDDDPEALERVESALDRLADTIDRASVGIGGEPAVEESAGDLREDVTLAWQAVEAPDAELGIVDSTAFRADHDLVVRLLANLFQNAVEHGGADVEIHVGTLPDGFFVEDDGVGIPEEDREAVLQRGYSTAEDGLGIGLTIVDDVAAAHGWEVAIADGRDGGARFEITGVERLDEEEADPTEERENV